MPAPAQQTFVPKQAETAAAGSNPFSMGASTEFKPSTAKSFQPSNPPMTQAQAPLMGFPQQQQQQQRMPPMYQNNTQPQQMYSNSYRPYQGQQQHQP